MLSSGFIYVLINPSMPGLAKVGKTMRNSTDRASELSSATGVPSPFILAFEQPVSNCDVAEIWVHRELDRAGYRLADRREFFNAPLHRIVDIVSKARKIEEIPEEVVPPGGALPEDASLALADELQELGLMHLTGTNSLLPNRRKAIKYFEQAAALGHAHACRLVGILYRWGDNGKGKDLETALILLNKAVLLGDWQSLADIASIFLEAGNVGATETYWNRFFSAAQEAINRSAERAYAEVALCNGGVTYCETVAADELKHCVDPVAFNSLSSLLLDGIEKAISKVSMHSDSWWVEHKQSSLSKARSFIGSQARTSP